MRRNINVRKIDKISRVFHALSNPDRLKILEILRDGESHTVGDICKKVGIRESTLSHHLAKMKLMGIINSNRLGRNIYYSLVMYCLKYPSINIKG